MATGERKREQVTIRLPKETLEEIKKEADKLSVSFNEMMNILLYEGVTFRHSME